MRQALHRARERVRAGRPRFASSPAEHRRLLERFIAACATGELEGLEALLGDSAALTTDGGGKAQAARKVVQGGPAVARALLGLARKQDPHCTVEICELNGWPAALLYCDDVTIATIAIECDGLRIHAIHVVNNPDKLTALR